MSGKRGITMKKSKWKNAYRTQLSLSESIWANNIPYLLGRKCLKVSEIAEQYYCEKKVELAGKYGEEESEEGVLGRDGHEELTAGLKGVTPRKAWKQIGSKKPLWLSEFLFFAKYKNFYIAFKPDRMLLRYPEVKMLIEFKFSRYSQPFKNYHVQLQTEGILLNSLGFTTDSLYYLIIVAPSEIERDSAFLNSIPARVYKNRECYELGIPILFDSITGYLYKFDMTEAQRDLEWALKFWREKRSAQRTDNKNKCRSCEFYNKCQKKERIREGKEKKTAR